MAICTFFQRGQCKFGNNCRNEHVASSFSANGRPVQFSGGADRYRPNQQSAVNRPNDRDRGTGRDVQYHDLKTDIKLDLTLQRPTWPFSCYCPTKDATGRLLIEGIVEVSPEEMRFRYYSQKQAGNERAAAEEENRLLSQVEETVRKILNDLDGAVKYTLTSDNTPNRPQSNQSGLMAKSTPTFGQPSNPAFGRPSNPGQSGSAFGQPSALGRGPAFGAPSMPGTSVFGQPSGLGQATTFGQPSAVGSSGSPFAQPSVSNQTSTFSKPSALGQPAASAQAGTFGQPSTLGRPVFGQSGFTQPSQPPGGSPFGQQQAQNNSSPFSQQQPAQRQQTQTLGASPFSQQQTQNNNNPFNRSQPTQQPTQPAKNPFGPSDSTKAPGPGQSGPQTALPFQPRNAPGLRPSVTFSEEELDDEDTFPDFKKPGQPITEEDRSAREASPEDYEGERGKQLAEVYKRARETRKFERGKIPDVPPKYEWIIGEF